MCPDISWPDSERKKSHSAKLQVGAVRPVLQFIHTRFLLGAVYCCISADVVLEV